MLRNLSLFVLCCFASVLQAAPDFDFSKGSDERLIESVSNFGEEYYKSVVAAYEERCEGEESDVLLAVERCRFIEYFLYSEDFIIASAEEDHERAISFLDEKYAAEPEAMLYNLDNTYGEEFFVNANEMESATNRWPAKLRAQFCLLIAQRAQWNETSIEAIDYAVQAYRLDRKPETANLYAGLLIEKDRGSEALVVLDSVDFAPANGWAQQTAMQYYLELEETQTAFAIYERIKDDEEVYISNQDVANVIALQGDLDRARDVLLEVKVSEWNRESTLLARLAFEIKHGDLDTAVSAYEAYREIGWKVDPFNRKWLEVALAFGEAPWGSLKLSGVFASLVALLLFMAIPFVVILPLHYWSVVRQLSGKEVAWSYGPWGLRTVLIVGCILSGAGFFLSWWDSEWGLRELFGYETSVLTEELTLSLVQYVHLDTAISLLVLGATFFFTRSLSLLGLGSLSVWKTLGFSFLALVSFQVITAVHVAIFPDLNAVASETVTDEMMRALFDTYGFKGLWLEIGLFGPIAEELLFRGVLLGAFSKRIPFWAANAFQSALFTLIHEDMRLAVFYFIFGMTCGWLVKRSGALAPSIVLHVLNNSLVCLGLWAIWTIR